MKSGMSSPMKPQMMQKMDSTTDMTFTEKPRWKNKTQNATPMHLAHYHRSTKSSNS